MRQPTLRAVLAVLLAPTGVIAATVALAWPGAPGRRHPVGARGGGGEPPLARAARPRGSGGRGDVPPPEPAATAARTPPGSDLVARPAQRASFPGPEEVAARFVSVFLGFEWDDRPDAVRLRCRPFDTAELDRALGMPGLFPDRSERAAAHEADRVTVVAVDPQDRAADHLDATVVARVTVSRPAQPDVEVTRYVDVRVVASALGWSVGQAEE